VALLYGASGYAALVRLADGDVDEAARQVDRAAASALPAWAICTARLAIALYCDDRARIASELAGLRREWPRLQRTRLLQHPVDGVRLPDLRGRAAVALVRGASAEEKPALLREAEESARWLESRTVPWAAPHAAALRAGIAAARGERDACAPLYQQAVEKFEAVSLPMHAALARYRLGALIGDGAGQALLAEASEWFRREEIRDPERFARAVMAAPS
jgi:eukaryotic-like serine/threonine-protein kinase